MNSMLRDSHDNFGPLLRWIGLFIATYKKFGADLFRYVKIIGPKILKMVKNAPIWLIFCVQKQLTKRFYHTKYEPNQSIFDHFQIFGPNYFDVTEKVRPKFFICCYK